jgi:hypothetical protein
VPARLGERPQPQPSDNRARGPPATA